MAVIRAEPLGWVSFGVRLLAGDGMITELRISAFRGKGSFELDGEAFSVQTEGFLQNRATLRKGSTTVALAKKTSTWRRRFEISSAGHRLVLEGRGWMGRDYVLLLGKQEVGWVKREGFSGRKLRLEFPDHVPTVLQVFLTYIVVGQARREAAAGAASG